MIQYNDPSLQNKQYQIEANKRKLNPIQRLSYQLQYKLARQIFDLF